MNYMGQGAWIIVNADSIDGSVNPFYAIMPEWFLPIGIVLATMAAIVACQASITSSYTLISEAISLNFWPKIRIKYPSQVIGQMYVPTINWIVYGCCLFSVFHFRNSAALENVYGFTVTITMLMTSTLVVVYLRQKNKPLWAIVPQPGACAFCLTVASRGFKYRSESAAGRQRHDGCRCTPVVDHDTKNPALEGYDIKALEDLYDDLTKRAGSNKLKDITKVFKERMRGHESWEELLP
jgi:hypothetical protein